MLVPVEKSGSRPAAGSRTCWLEIGGGAVDGRVLEELLVVEWGEVLGGRDVEAGKVQTATIMSLDQKLTRWFTGGREPWVAPASRT